MDNERAAAILKRARQALESKPSLVEDYELRRMDDRTIPTLPVRRDELKAFYKWYDDSKETPATSTATATSTPTDDWAAWINDRIDAETWVVYQVVAEQFLERDAKVKDLESEIEELRAEIASRKRAPRKPTKQITISEPFLRLRGSSSNAA